NFARIVRGSIVVKFGARSASIGLQTVICALFPYTTLFRSLNHVGWDADRAVAVEVQVEYGLKRLEHRAVAGDGAIAGTAGPDTATVCAPDFELSGAGVLQRHVIAACELNRCDRCPTAKLARIDRGAIVLKFGARSARNGIELVTSA